MVADTPQKPNARYLAIWASTFPGMTENFEHRTRALQHIEDAEVEQRLLDALRDSEDAPQRHARIAQCHQNIGHSLKLAHIEATLDVAAAFRDWTEISHKDDATTAPLFSLPGVDDE